MINDIYDDFVKSEKIYPIIIPRIQGYEIGWEIKDINSVLQWLKSKNKIILGGDIVNLLKEYTYDNWYYNYNNSISYIDNVNNSFIRAQEYTAQYLKKNGDKYYVIIVYSDDPAWLKAIN